MGQVFVSSSYLESSSLEYLLHHVSCTGNESSISQCSMIKALRQSCQSNLPASVICQGRLLHTLYCSYSFSRHCYLPDSSFNASICNDGAIQLVEGVDNSTGRLEVCFNKAWGTVCRHRFGSMDAQVACHQLGFPTKG